MTITVCWSMTPIVGLSLKMLPHMLTPICTWRVIFLEACGLVKS